MKDKKFMSYKHHVIWYNNSGYMVAKGDGTDFYFNDWHDAMKKIDEIENAKEQKKTKNSKTRG